MKRVLEFLRTFAALTVMMGVMSMATGLVYEHFGFPIALTFAFVLWTFVVVFAFQVLQQVPHR